MSYASEQGVLNAQWNAASMACAAEEQRMRPSVLFRPVLTLDGNAYCALYGESLMCGCAGFGETAELAMADFDKNWHEQKVPKGSQSDRASIVEECAKVADLGAVTADELFATGKATKKQSRDTCSGAPYTARLLNRSVPSPHLPVRNYR